MRSDTLLFLHVLLGMALLGGLLTATAAALAARGRQDSVAASLRRASWWGMVVAVAGAVGALMLGEALAGKEDLGDPAWLDVSRALATIGLLAGGVVLALVARLSISRPRLTGVVGWLGAVLTLISLAVAFVMTAKPGSGSG